MKYVKHFKCIDCQQTYPVDKPMNLCPKDDRPLQLVLDINKIKADFSDSSWFRPSEKSMWRYGPLMPFDIKTESDHICSLGEGYTPIINISQYSLCKELGISAGIKDEGQAYKGFGSNPTGSFKDRGMAMVATMARYYGLTRLVVPTQGNAGDSLSEYGVKHGLDIVVVMPDDTPMPILGKVAAYSLQYGKIQLELVKGTIREAGVLMKQKFLPDGYFNCATFQEPGWRIEGKKTMGFELAEYSGLKSQSGKWSLPDVVVYPAGGGTGILGMWKAFDELEALGVIDAHRPKIIVVQSDQNAPIVDAYEQGLTDSVPTDGGKTLATGLNVPGGVGHKAVLAIVRESKGAAIKVSEAEIENHSRGIFKQFGMWISPEGAATVAALKHAKELNLVMPADNIVCFNTGSAEKYMPNLRHLFNADISE